MPEPGTTVLFVKKLLADGEACAKCRDVEQRLHRDGLMRRVSQVMIADAGDPGSPGMVVADRLGVQRAPFFVLRRADGTEEVVESYLALKRLLSGADGDAADLADVVDRHPDLAFI